MTLPKRWLIIILLLGCSIWSAAWYRHRPQLLTARLSHNDDQFGYTLAVAGDQLAVGAFGDGQKGKKAGAVYLFERVEGVWRESAKLVAADAQPFSSFGTAVSLSPTDLVIFSCTDRSYSRSGTIYAYERDGSSWLQRQTLTVPGCPQSPNLLALHHNMLVAGLPATREARLFVKENGRWQRVASLIPQAVSLYSRTDEFARLRAVAANGNYVVLGLADGAGVFVFARDGENGRWHEAQPLIAPGSSSSFGWAVAILNEQILVGDPAAEVCEDGICLVSGAAHLFRFDGQQWQHQQQLQPASPVAAGWFGGSVALQPAQALIGAPQEAAGAFGAAYLFAECGDGWQQVRRLTAGSNPRATAALARATQSSRQLMQQRDLSPSKVWQAARGGFLYPVLLSNGPAIAQANGQLFIAATHPPASGQRPVYIFDQAIPSC